MIPTNLTAWMELRRVAEEEAKRVLAEAGRPMTCRAMVEAMAAKGLWTSPGGKTPEATLYSSLLRQIRAKGKEARFKKVARGQFDLAKRPC